jgi:predicted nucleotidyltransferase
MEMLRYIETIESLQGKTLNMDKWLEMMKSSPKIVEKLAPFDFQTVSFSRELHVPAIVTDKRGVPCNVHFVFDQTPQPLIHGYMAWTREHQNEIQRGEVKYLYVEDTRARRFYHKLEAMGLKDNVIRRATEQKYPREKLIADLQGVADAIPSLDLPATIEEIRVFGSVARGKPVVGDVDLYVKLSFSIEDLVRLYTIRAGLGEKPKVYSNSQCDLYGLYKSIKDVGPESVRKALDRAGGSCTAEQKKATNSVFDLLLRLDAMAAAGKANQANLIDMVLAAGMHYKTLREIIKHEKQIRDLLESIHYPIDWFLNSMTLNEFRTAYYEYPFLLNVERITMRLLKGTRKGFHHIFFTDDQVTANSILAWSSKYPDVEANINGRSPEDVMAHLIRDFDVLHDEVLHFHENAMTLYGAREVPPLIEPEVARAGNESESELRDKISVIREQLRKIKYKWQHMPD